MRRLRSLAYRCAEWWGAVRGPMRQRAADRKDSHALHEWQTRKLKALEKVNAQSKRVSQRG